jgi:hypothetical protein
LHICKIIRKFALELQLSTALARQLFRNPPGHGAGFVLRINGTEAVGNIVDNLFHAAKVQKIIENGKWKMENSQNN